MVKELHSVRVYYDVMVVTDQCSGFPINVAQDNLPNIIENETPKYEYLSSVYALNETDPWYSAIPYGDSDGKSCYYYTADAMIERRKVVEDVKKMLTTKEWDALVSEIRSEDT